MDTNSLPHAVVYFKLQDERTVRQLLALILNLPDSLFKETNRRYICMFLFFITSYFQSFQISFPTSPLCDVARKEEGGGNITFSSQNK